MSVFLKVLIPFFPSYFKMGYCVFLLLKYFYLNAYNKYCNNAVHASIFPSNNSAQIRASLPEAPRRRVPPARGLLRDCARRDVLVLHAVGLALRELLCALLDDGPGPFVDLFVLEDLLAPHRVHDGPTRSGLHEFQQTHLSISITTITAALHLLLLLCLSLCVCCLFVVCVLLFFI